MENIIGVLILFGIGYLFGSIAESNHFKVLKSRESNMLRMPVVTMSKRFYEDMEVDKVWLVHGSAVISIDYFKRVLANLRNIFGGEVKSYESLIDRARREAVIRMKEHAVGANMIVNLRIETSTIGRRANQKGNVGSVEAFAYGTAVTYKK